MKIIKYIRKITLDEKEHDFIIINTDIEENTNKLINFCLIQISGIPPKQIVKYDYSHGYCQVHKYYTHKKEPEKIDLDLSFETVIKLREEIKNKWQIFKAKYKLERINNMNVI